MISLTSDIMSDSVSIEEADKMPVEITTGRSGSFSSENQGGIKACPTDSVENSPTGELVIVGACITEKNHLCGVLGLILKRTLSISGLSNYISVINASNNYFQKLNL